MLKSSGKSIVDEMSKVVEEVTKVVEEKSTEMTRVMDNIYIRRCYKCYGFNHHKIDCKNEQACPRCAGDHEVRDCQSTIRKCVNCIKCNRRTGENFDSNHDIWSNKCNVFKIKLESSKKMFSHIK